MKLIECRNQENIFEYIDFILENDYPISQNNNKNSILVIIKKDSNIIATAKLFVKDNSVEINELIIKEYSASLQKEILSLIEKLCFEKGFNIVTAIVLVKETQVFKDCGYISIGDIYVDSGNLVLNVQKLLK